jgi:hypothetical protein
LGQVVGPIRARRRERAGAERRVLDVLHGPPAPMAEVDPYSMGVFRSDAAAAAASRTVGAEARPPYVERTSIGCCALP